MFYQTDPYLPKLKWFLNSCTANLANKRVHSGNTVLFSIDGPGKEVRRSLGLERVRFPIFFYCIVLLYKVSPLNWRKFKKLWRETDVAKSVHEAHYSNMQIMTLKGTAQEMYWIDAVKNCVIFPQITYRIVSYARDFLPIKFLPNVIFKTPCFQLPQNVPWTDEMTRVISASTGIGGVSVARHIALKSTVTSLFHCIFRSKHWRKSCGESLN